ncbi:MAG: hypothetical protein EBR82_62230, partial [Caulobacteraceae bacterium]|nr:hypothetical protein [Caulobacteraceae bacterium]
MIALVLHGPNRFDRDNNGINLGPAGDLCRETFTKLNIDYDSEVWTTFASAFFTGDRPAGKISRIIFAGQKSLEYLANAKGKTLDAYRGVVYESASRIPYIATYWPQDCCDARAIEDELAGVDGDDGDDTDGDGKSTSPTKRTNYRFWFQRDVEKLLNYESLQAPAEAATCFVENTRDALN